VNVSGMADCDKVASDPALDKPDGCCSDANLACSLESCGAKCFSNFDVYQRSGAAPQIRSIDLYVLESKWLRARTLDIFLTPPRI